MCTKRNFLDISFIIFFPDSPTEVTRQPIFTQNFPNYAGVQTMADHIPPPKKNPLKGGVVTQVREK